MKKGSDYDKLIKMVDKKNEQKSYNSLLEEIEKLLEKSSSLYDKRNRIKSLIAFTEGKINRSWFMSIMSIAYALIIGSSSIFASISNDDNKKISIAFLLLVAALGISVVASRGKDFEKSFVLSVLKYKLEELDKCNKIKTKADDTKEEIYAVEIDINSECKEQYEVYIKKQENGI